MSDGGLGPLLRSHRHAAKLTLEQLSAASGVSVRAISDMERGHSRAPRRRTLAVLADALGLSPEDRRLLLSAADRGRPTSPPEGTREPPRPVPDFVGRAAELARLRRHAADATAEAPVPVAVIHGPPGVGKSALAVHAAEQLRDRFPDGVFFLDLRGIDTAPVTPDDGLARLLSALGVGPHRIGAGIDERAAQLRATLRARRCVVILDNASGEAQVRPLLPGAGASLVLVTSRRPLAGLESVLRLALDAFSARESAELLLGIVGPESDRVTPTAVAEVARLCAALPLALRIAGNRLLSRPGWTMAHLASRLSDAERRLATLTSGDLGVEAAFGLSYAQLSDSARQTFRRLSLIPGGDFAAPLAAVLAQSGVAAVEDRLDELTDLGLLQAHGPDRYRFHDLIRIFAAARLRSAEPESARQAARTRMVRWLLETAIAAGQWFEADDAPTPATGPSGVCLDSTEAAQEWLELERENWFAALTVAAEAGEHRLVVDVAEAMHWYSDRVAHWGGWTAVYRMAREAAGVLGDDRLTATQLNYLAWALSACDGRHAESAATAAEAFEVAGRAGDRSQQAWALDYLSRAEHLLGNLDAALEHVRQAVPLFEAAENHDGQLQGLLGVGELLLDLGRHREAMAAFHTVLDAVPGRRLKPIVATFARGQAQLKIGVCLSRDGRWAEAERHFSAALPEFAVLNIPAVAGGGHYWMGRAQHELGAPDAARSHLTEAVRLYESVEQDELVKLARTALAELDRTGSGAGS